MVILMDPLEDPDDILRANRSREKTYMFDVAFDYSASQVSRGAAVEIKGTLIGSPPSAVRLCAGGGVQGNHQRAD